jgi:hypothetical protein
LDLLLSAKSLIQLVYSCVKLVLVFRGADMDSLKNWIASIKFLTVSYPLCDNSKYFLISRV